MSELVILLLFAGVPYLAVALIGGVVRASREFRMEGDLQELDQKIWALERSALSVEFNKRSLFLETEIKEKKVGIPHFYKIKNVLSIVLPSHQSHHFNIYSLSDDPMKGVLADIRGVNAPYFMIVTRDRLTFLRRLEHRYLWSSSLTEFEIHDRINDFPTNCICLLRCREEDEPLVKERVEEFLLNNKGIFPLLIKPKFKEFYANQNYFAAYFAKEIGQYVENQELFEIDEMMAKAILKDRFEETNPDAEIQLLKDLEQEPKRGTNLEN